jgi:hypothetical protein
MRKLTQSEQNALRFVTRVGGSYCPNRDACAEPFITDTLDSLVRKKRLSVEGTDDGPRYTLTVQGEVDAAP